MYGQMTAGSWIYIGSQGIVQGTYETFVEAGRQHFGGDLRGRWILTAGLGGMGGAQPLAVTMNGGTVLCIDCDPVRARRRLATRYLDVLAETLDEGIALALEAKSAARAISIGVIGNAAEVLPELLRRGVDVDIVTDQTSAHDPLAYLPIGVSLEDWHDYAAAKPEEFTDRARASMATHVEAMVGFQDAGAEVFDYGNSIRGEAQLAGYSRAFDFPGFVPAYIRPLFCAGKGPFRWAALSGDPADIHATDSAVRRFARELGEHLEDLLCLAQADITTKRPEKKRRGLQQIDELKVRIAALAAEDSRVPPLPTGIGDAIMRAFALPPSRKVGELKLALERAVEAGEIAPQQETDAYVEFLRANGERFGLDR